MKKCNDKTIKIPLRKNVGFFKEKNILNSSSKFFQIAESLKLWPFGG